MSADKVIFYRDHARRWRWRYVAANGHILADSGQSYTRRIDAWRGAGHVIWDTRWALPEIEVVLAEVAG